MVSRVRVNWKAEKKRFLSRGLRSWEDPFEEKLVTERPIEEYRQHRRPYVI